MSVDVAKLTMPGELPVGSSRQERGAQAVYGPASASDTRRTMFFDELKRDLRQGRRALTQSPGFTAVAVLSLALGIGANTAIFTLVNAVLLRELPLERPEELVNVYLHQTDFPYSVLSHPDYDDLLNGTRDVFAQLSTSEYAPVRVDRTGRRRGRARRDRHRKLFRLAWG